MPTVDVAHVLLALWALAMGMQSSAVRHLHVEGVFTTAATATTILLVEALTKPSALRTAGFRLATILICLFIGASAGGLLLVNARLYAPVLPLGLTLFVVVMAKIFIRGAKLANQ